MARIRSRTTTSSLSHTVSAARLRSALQSQLRAMALPPQVSLPADSDLSTAALAGQHSRLGDYLRAHDLISKRDLTAALAEQRQRIASGQPIALGDLLVEQGRLTARELVTVLMLQQLDRIQQPATQTAPPLGELLVQAGLVTADQLAAALVVQTEARQRGETIRLGEILIAAGALSHDDLATTLAHQRRSRDI